MRGADCFFWNYGTASPTVFGGLETRFGTTGRAVEQSLQGCSRVGVVSTKVHLPFAQARRLLQTSAAALAFIRRPHSIREMLSSSLAARVGSSDISLCSVPSESDKILTPGVAA